MNHFSKFALYTITFLILFTPFMAHAQWSKAENGTLIIRGGWLFDGVSDTRRRNSGIIIRNGEIVDVDANVDVEIPVSANVIDLQDSETILPGLIDMHAHYNLDLVDAGRVEYDVHLRDAILPGMDRVEHQLTLGSGGPAGPEDHAGWELQVKPLRGKQEACG